MIIFNDSIDDQLFPIALRERKKQYFTSSNSKFVTVQGQGQSQSDDSGDYSAIPGTAGVDYPIYTEIPKTSFDCKNQQFPGYYADVEAQCQVFHICALNTTFDFLCPNGTIFSQEHLVCVWWNQFDCNSAPSLYGNNAYIYDYSKTGQTQDNSNQGGQSPSRNFPSADASNNFDGAQGGFGASPSNTGFGTTQAGSSGFGAPSTGFGGSQPSANAFGVSQPSSNAFGGSQPSSNAFGGSQPSTNAFGTSQPGTTGFGTTPSVSPGFGSSSIGYPSASAAGAPSFNSAQPSSTAFGGSQPSANIPSSSGFGQPAASHSSGLTNFHSNKLSRKSVTLNHFVLFKGFGHTSHLPSSGAGHTSSHNVPSGHSFPSQTGVEYPIAPPSDYQPSVITPTLPSSPAPFANGVTGYPAAGTPPSPSLNGAADQPSREYLPSRRTQ